MKNNLSHQHKHRFEEIKKSLTEIGSKEGNFIKVELLFYEVLTIAREYGDDVNENHLLAALKHLQGNQYEQTKAIFKKNTQREHVIRRFINELKNVLTSGIKGSYLQSQL